MSDNRELHLDWKLETEAKGVVVATRLRRHCRAPHSIYPLDNNATLRYTVEVEVEVEVHT